ncbi:MAG: anaerobic sulfatase maturase [Armatimonadetes bacterium]|nr:anaerobic sulfatase maturase [Armatimonadota bacterium]
MHDAELRPWFSGSAERRFHLMAKPIGATCNLNCTYCYYLSKNDLLGRSRRMSDGVLEAYVQQYIAAQDSPEIVFSWQGGEPTLLGLDFFRKAVELERKHCPPGKRVANDLQTNGTLLDDAWCAFLRDNGFLVGLSVDGPPALHDRYRLDRKRKPTCDRVVAAARRLRKHGVPFNTLTVVNRANAKHPVAVYRFLRREMGATRIQFIPAVEPRVFARVAPQHWDEKTLPTVGAPEARPGAPGSVVTDWSVDQEDYGTFLCAVFDEWCERDVGQAFVYLFECAVAQWMGLGASLCTLAQTCGRALAIEHDGSVYSCDHYVYPEYRLGNIIEQPLADIVYSFRQAAFGQAKNGSLPAYCRQCRYFFACHGECPKNRFIRTPDGEPGLNYLCSGLRAYFAHIDPYMQAMARQLQSGAW